MKRWLGFVIVILVGITAGLYYGWVINPVRYVDTTPTTLRIDYKSDYVLMVAEAFRMDKSLDQTMRRLGFLGAKSPLDSVQEAIIFATQKGYTDSDLAQMRALEKAVQTWKPFFEQATP